MTADVAQQLDLALRLLVSAALGGLIGLEREIHGHPAGTRTHLLVALGSAIFTVLSMHGFAGQVDPTRIAAQIVSGIGFLGAGAIIRSGASVRGLTTAASLWASAAIGLAAGAAYYPVAFVGTAIIVFSLWPLRRLVRGLSGGGDRQLRVRVEVSAADSIAGISERVAATGAELTGVETRSVGEGRQEVWMQLRFRGGTASARLVERVAGVPGVVSVSITEQTDPG